MAKLLNWTRRTANRALRKLGFELRRIPRPDDPWNAGLTTSLTETLAPAFTKPYIVDQAAVELDKLRSHAKGVGYSHYLYGLLCGARTARAIGVQSFTAIEFGVAGGNGLVAMEQYAALVEQQWGISINLVGFDTSSGLPHRTNPRDCPFAFRGGEFAMDERKLRSRLLRAELRLGDVADTVRAFASEQFAPIGFISNDLDLYTSTRDSFHLLNLEPHRLLPRVAMYFDDLLGYPYTSVTGEWSAINEFNTVCENRQLGKIHGLKYALGPHYRFAHWTEEFFVLHVFDHPAYNSPETVTMPKTELWPP
jgi:hypothetical protein